MALSFIGVVAIDETDVEQDFSAPFGGADDDQTITLSSDIAVPAGAFLVAFGAVSENAATSTPPDCVSGGPVAWTNLLPAFSDFTGASITFDSSQPVTASGPGQPVTGEAPPAELYVTEAAATVDSPLGIGDNITLTWKLLAEFDPALAPLSHEAALFNRAIIVTAWTGDLQGCARTRAEHWGYTDNTSGGAGCDVTPGDPGFTTGQPVDPYYTSGISNADLFPGVGDQVLGMIAERYQTAFTPEAGFGTFVTYDMDGGSGPRLRIMAGPTIPFGTTYEASFGSFASDTNWAGATVNVSSPQGPSIFASVGGTSSPAGAAGTWAQEPSISLVGDRTHPVGGS